MPELAFFVGKGGVGKTTVSSAYAVRLALKHPRHRVLLISTDPAHSLCDILKSKLKSRATSVRLPRPGKLFAWQVDSEELFRDFLQQYKEEILRIIDVGAIFSRDDIEPLIDSTLPGMAEVSALLAIYDAFQSDDYEHIVVDTAPFGHTLRLFQLPEHFLRFLSFLELAASRDRVLAAHFGGHGSTVGEQFLTTWRQNLESIQNAFAKVAGLFLVTSPEKFSLNESLRCASALAAYSPPLEFGAVVLNRTATPRSACKLCTRKAKEARHAHQFLAKHFPGTAIYSGEDACLPLSGVDSLAKFAAHIFDGKRLQLDAASPRVISPRFNRVDWPTLDVPLSLVLGKGGVGKTTLSVALGFANRSHKKATVEICSVDPAPSLDDIFQAKIGNRSQPVLGDPQFRASEMDSVALFQEWVGDIRTRIDQATGAEVSGIHVDLSFERQLLSQLLEIVPPGVDEVLAIFRIIDLLSGAAEHVVIDMAPTGHALELLRMPERILAWTRPLLKTLAAHRTLAIARDAAVKIAELGQRVRELADILRDSQASRIHAVMLAEPLPDRETERLMADLRILNLSPNSLFINRVLFPQDVGKCARCRRGMQWQHATLSGLKRKYPRLNLYVVRNFPSEITGKTALRSFTRELWRLA